MKLYYKAGACSLSPHIVAQEAGIDLQLVNVDLAVKKLDDGADYFAVNGKGYVPALEVGGQVLTEGPAIVQYLADQKPESGLAPKAGTMERYQLQEWLNFISTELHKGFGSFFNKAQTPEWRAAVEATLTKRLDWLQARLADKSYLMGETFTVADAYLFTVLNWGKFTGVDIAKWPKLAAYQQRVAARPKVQAALKAEGLLA